MSDATTPSWWAESELAVFETEDEQQQAKVRAAGQVLGFMLNVSSDSDDGQRLRTWFTVDDFPGPFRLIAEAIWESYDGNVVDLVMRLVAEGKAGRIRNGTLVTDLYWEASFAESEWASFVLYRIRQREELVARSAAQIAAIAPFRQD